MISLDKYAKKYGDIPYPENISEKQAKKYVETYVKLGRSRGRAKGEVLKKYKKTISRLRKSGYVVPENIKLPAKYDTLYIYAQSFKPKFIRVYMHVVGRLGLKQSRQHRHHLTFMS